MLNTPDYFSDLLAPGEAILAAIGGPGPDGDGTRTWYQVALTADRLLVVEMVQPAKGRSYQPMARHALPRSAVRISRFPRTPRSDARLEIEGLGETVIIRDVDDPSVFPYLEPFLQAWGGPVGGAGVVREAAPADAADDRPPPGSPDKGLLLWVTAAGVLMVAGCCGFSGLLWVLHKLLSAFHMALLR